MRALSLLCVCLIAPSLLHAENTCPTGDTILQMFKDRPLANYENFMQNPSRVIKSMNNLIVKFVKAYDANFKKPDGSVGGNVGFGIIGENGQSFTLKKDSSNLKTCEYDVTLKPDQKILKGPVTFSLEMQGTESEKNMPTYNICPTSIAKGVNQDAKAFTEQLTQLSEGKPVTWGNVTLSLKETANQDSLKGIMKESGQYSPTLGFASFKVSGENNKDVACTYRYKRHTGKEHIVTFTATPSKK